MDNLPIAAFRSQLIAALRTLKECLETYPGDDWTQTDGDAPFSQVVFHVLVYCDYDLSESLDACKAQDFHTQHAAVFADYEEFEDKLPVRVYDRGFLEAYWSHCEAKARALTDQPWDEMLREKGDARRYMTRLERLINTVRHVQHHAAQLGLRIQLRTGRELKWFSRGE